MIYVANLRDQWTPGQSTDLIALAPGSKLSHLDNVYTFEPRTVSLNDRAGSIGPKKTADDHKDDPGTRKTLLPLLRKS